MILAIHTEIYVNKSWEIWSPWFYRLELNYFEIYIVFLEFYIIVNYYTKKWNYDIVSQQRNGVRGTNVL